MFPLVAQPKLPLGLCVPPYVTFIYELHVRHILTLYTNVKTPVCAALFRGDSRNTFISLSRRYLSRLRRSEKSYGTPSDYSGDLSGKKSNMTKIRRQGNIDSESVDDLFSRQVGSEFDGESGSIELNSVIVR
jgi:hypothetical protein